MKIFNRQEVTVECLPGRDIQRAIGKGSFSESAAMTVGYTTISDHCGPMEPHKHAEETILCLSSSGGKVHWGDSKDDLTEVYEMKPGTVLHIPPEEWHVFSIASGGFLEFIFIYGSTDDVRPEDKK